ncbi:hypothetical protein AWM75_02825 [Aerococcus urinaehominis]|uniref:Uncharacterized protein n=2 Tax=Aerococcus urinaehominis TaxID=128944 RepID=A0A109RGD6_9LACT|nr:hypothetical protein [Aerococcus urinaehominis]AMB98995.1 hypothetical protein AWM75_02825 [Aerococcus urinaehominis]
MSQDSQCDTDGNNQYEIMSQVDIINWVLQISTPNTNDHQLIQALRQASISELSTSFLYQLAPDYPIKTGIYCQACQSFELKNCYQSFICTCGGRESKAELTKRMLVEYALIHYRQPINMKHFKHFTNGILSNYNIQSALKKYDRLHRGCYLNPYAAHYPKTPSLSRYS